MEEVKLQSLTGDIVNINKDLFFSRADLPKEDTYRDLNNGVYKCQSATTNELVMFAKYLYTSTNSTISPPSEIQFLLDHFYVDKEKDRCIKLINNSFSKLKNEIIKSKIELKEISSGIFQLCITLSDETKKKLVSPEAHINTEYKSEKFPKHEVLMSNNVYLSNLWKSLSFVFCKLPNTTEEVRFELTNKSFAKYVEITNESGCIYYLYNDIESSFDKFVSAIKNHEYGNNSGGWLYRGFWFDNIYESLVGKIMKYKKSIKTTLKFKVKYKNSAGITTMKFDIANLIIKDNNLHFHENHRKHDCDSYCTILDISVIDTKNEFEPASINQFKGYNCIYNPYNHMPY